MDELKKQTLETEFGQKATVQREEVEGEIWSRANEQLAELGRSLDPTAQQVLDYKGSAAVHIFQSPRLGQVFFVSQTEGLRNCNEIIASKAISDLRGRSMETFGRKAPTKRSGF